MGQPAKHSGGLSLAPFRATRYTPSARPLGRRLSPPYDVVSADQRARLVAGDARNVARLILPEAAEAELGGGDPYLGAGRLLDDWLAQGVLTVEDEPALYVYEMGAADGTRTRGLLGAVELRDPADGVILPHENTMAGPVADRLALMTATDADLEPIYLVYDGGGDASRVVAGAAERPPLVNATSPDGMTHRLWALTEAQTHAEIEADLASRRAVIADGHHRYATYLQRQSDHHGAPGPWDRGLTLLVDASTYGPQVHPIHRVVRAELVELLAATRRVARVSEPITLAEVEAALAAHADFAVALSAGQDAVVVSDIDAEVVRRGLGKRAGTALAGLDVTTLHHVLVEQVWRLPDTTDTVAFAHTAAEALDMAREQRATAVLLRATPIQDVTAVAAAGDHMPRKSTLFTPKPASGIVIRRLRDQ